MLRHPFANFDESRESRIRQTEAHRAGILFHSSSLEAYVERRAAF
jgi:hypothetical protein